MTFSQKVFQLLTTLPPGRITTYGAIASALGSPRSARAVGRILATNPYWRTTNCYRVVRQDGSLASYRGNPRHLPQKIRRLRLLGCQISHNRILNLSKHLHTF